MALCVLAVMEWNRGASGNFKPRLSSKLAASCRQKDPIQQSNAPNPNPNIPVELDRTCKLPDRIPPVTCDLLSCLFHRIDSRLSMVEGN